jgi:deferrochelatase/peroxidase EfeB
LCIAGVMTDLPLSDIQGVIVRGYRSYIHARHIVVAITNAGEARSIIGSLATGSSPSGLAITTAAPWTTKPPFTLNVAFTYLGLETLGVPQSLLSGFSAEFISGAIGEATNNFDVGSSAPASWLGGMGVPDNVQVIFSLFAPTAEALETYSALLRTALKPGFQETYSHDGTALPGGYVHFDYRDSISQPSLQGGPPPAHPYPSELGASPAGDFLLGYENTYQNFYCPDIAQEPLGKNGSFGAFRILKQDVAAFDSYLQQASGGAGLTPDQLAAKFLGRWRNGVPLALSPKSDAPIPEDQLNMFLYVGTATGQKYPDPHGVACPVGSHIRRGNPRDDGVAGGSTQQARIMRRAMPYGPRYDPALPDDGIERGLIGYFINGDFGTQFEFLMGQWMNLDGFTRNLPITGADPLIGDNDPSSSVFTIATAPKASTTVTGFARFVITRGSAYCFLPSITALSYLASL